MKVYGVKLVQSFYLQFYCLFVVTYVKVMEIQMSVVTVVIIKKASTRSLMKPGME